MQTATKNNFTDEEIRSLIRRHFPDEEIRKVTPLPGGTFNTLYRIEGSGELSRGVILKTGPGMDVVLPRHERDILRTEYNAYQLLEGQELPIPKIYAGDFSRTVLPCDYFIMERLSGDTWFDHWPIKEPRLKYELGVYTARFHQVKGDHFGTLGEDEAGRYDTWGAAFLAMVEDALAEVREQGLPYPGGRLCGAVFSRIAMLDECRTPVLVNFDLWAGNVFVKKKKRYRISGLIDFERSFFGDPLASFASALLLYDDVTKEKDFQEGYTSVTGEPLAISSEDREKMILYEILMFLLAYIESHRYGFWFSLVQRTAIRFYSNLLLRRLDRMERKRRKTLPQ